MMAVFTGPRDLLRSTPSLPRFQPHRLPRLVLERRVQRQLQQAKARMLGVVFNDAAVEESASSYAYYYPNGHRRK